MQTKLLSKLWVCLKIVYPIVPNGQYWLMIIIPTTWLFHWGIPHFQTYPYGFGNSIISPHAPQERPHLGHAQRSIACGLAQWRRHLGGFHGRLQRRAHAAGGPGTSTTWASPGRSCSGDFMGLKHLQLWPFISYNWLFLWDYTIYKWGYVSTYNLYFGP